MSIKIDIKNINREIWRVRFSLSSDFITDIADRINWCKNQFGEQNQTPKRWKHVEDSSTIHRFWFYNEEDYVMFNLSWLNE